jgi:hypothetical protein
LVDSKFSAGCSQHINNNPCGFDIISGRRKRPGSAIRTRTLQFSA